MCNVSPLRISFIRAACLFTLEHICVKIGAGAVPCSMLIVRVTLSKRRRRRHRKHLRRHTVQICFLGCDFGARVLFAARALASRLLNTVSQWGFARNEDVILDFCRFSCAINAPLCVFVILFKHSVGVCVGVYGPPNFEISDFRVMFTFKPN